MSKSQRLRHCDLVNIYRLLGDCRDLGADPLAWRRRLVDGLMKLTGARVAYVVGLLGFPGPGIRADELVHLALEESGQTKLFREHFEFMARGGEDPMISHFAALPLDRQHTRSAHHVLDLDEWRRSESFQRFHRRMDMDAGILSLRPVRSERGRSHHTLSVRRGLGERSFSLRDVRIIDCLHRELARDIGRRLAPTSAPSACELSPRLRQTLEGLLDGMNEKQIADVMGISRATVHEYVMAIYRRYGVESRGELMARWIRYARGLAPCAFERPPP